MIKLKKALNSLINKEELNKEDYYQIFKEIITTEELNEIQLSAFLFALNLTNINENILIGAVKALRQNMIKINAPKEAIDVCGSGGDGLNSLNISTATAITVAACGVPVAKHGNKAVSSKSGSADIFQELGIKINIKKEQLEQSLKNDNLCFIFAPLYHPALKKIGNVRKNLGVRTIFNFIGPLLNPAQVTKQLIGVSEQNIMKPMAKTLISLGCKKAMIVRGCDGMDEITMTGKTNILEIDNKNIKEYQINPIDYGFKLCSPEDLKGGKVKYNAKRLVEALGGKTSPYLDAIIINSAAALYIAGIVNSINDGVYMAKKAIERKDALRKIDY